MDSMVEDEEASEDGAMAMDAELAVDSMELKADRIEMAKESIAFESAAIA